MKIGVITFWYGNDNYGMIMQCWALQKYLRKQGHNPFVIRYNPTGGLLKRIVKRILLLTKLLLNQSFRENYRSKSTLDSYNKEKNLCRDFDGFRKHYISFSTLEYHYIEKLIFFPPKADCYISGSDQIWRGSLRYNNMKAFFLDFGSRKVRRVAYAPSFGMKEYYDGEIELLSKALSNYDYLSCREYDGVAICKKAGYEATKVEDPTLLLDSSEYVNLCEEVSYSDYLFIYSLNIQCAEDIFWHNLRMTFPSTNVVVTPSSGYIPGREIFGDDVIYDYATPQKWLSLIKNAQLVVTSSFHGVVFSIIFNVKFAFIPLKGGKAATNNRVLDLLNALGLESCIVANGVDYDRLLKNEINWRDVNERKRALLRSSSSFISRALA